MATGTKILLILILLISGIKVSAQSDFRKGFVILPNGDTLKGLVNYGNRKRNFVVCMFKNTGSSKTTDYKPESLKAYGFDGSKFYESWEHSFATGKKNVFMEVVIKGKLSIFSYEETFFTRKDNGALVELKVELREQKANGKTYLNTVKKYVGVLSLMTADCENTRNAVSKTRLTTKSLAEFATLYNTCMGSPFTDFESRKKWFKVNYRVFAGISSSKMKFVGNVQPYLTYSSIDQDVTPMFGTGVDFSSPRISEKFFFLVELLYVKHHFQGDYPISSTAHTGHPDFSVDSDHLRLPLGLRYNFSTGGFTPFLKGGVMYDFVLNNATTGARPPAVPFKSPLPGLWFSLGLEKRITKGLRTYLELRREVGNGVYGEGSNQISELSSYCVQLGLSF